MPKNENQDRDRERCDHKYDRFSWIPSGSILEKGSDCMYSCINKNERAQSLQAVLGIIVIFVLSCKAPVEGTQLHYAV